jgi:predicted nucleotidyltransferase
MKTAPLSEEALEAIRSVLQQHAEVRSAVLFGSRAKGSHTERSDIDIALIGGVLPLVAQSIAAELDDLPLPQRFELQPIEHIVYQPLLDHIRRVGIVIYTDS